MSLAAISSKLGIFMCADMNTIKEVAKAAQGNRKLKELSFLKTPFYPQSSDIDKIAQMLPDVKVTATT